MEKILNTKLKNVFIEEDCLDKLNNLIEQNFVNSQVLILVDFFVYKNYYFKLEELKKCSLNNIKYCVVYNYKKTKLELDAFIDETFSLIVGMGSFDIIKFTQSYAIKNNINYAFVNLYNLKSEIFCNFLSNSNNFNIILPTFVLINKLKLTKEEQFNMRLNIYKYTYLLFDNQQFFSYYLKIISNLRENNLYEKTVALGLVLNKFNLNFFVKNSYNEFKNFIFNQSLLLIYKNIFKNLNINNLLKINSLGLNIQEFFNYKNFNFNYNKFYLLTNKNSFLERINTINDINEKIIIDLKQKFLPFLYYNCNIKENFNILNIKKANIYVDFLTNMKYFSIFDKVLKMFA